MLTFPSPADRCTKFIQISLHYLRKCVGGLHVGLSDWLGRKYSVHAFALLSTHGIGSKSRREKIHLELPVGIISCEWFIKYQTVPLEEMSWKISDDSWQVELECVWGGGFVKSINVQKLKPIGKQWMPKDILGIVEECCQSWLFVFKDTKWNYWILDQQSVYRLKVIPSNCDAVEFEADGMDWSAIGHRMWYNFHLKGTNELIWRLDIPCFQVVGICPRVSNLKRPIIDIVNVTWRRGFRSLAVWRNEAKNYGDQIPRHLQEFCALTDRS